MPPQHPLPEDARPHSIMYCSETRLFFCHIQILIKSVYACVCYSKDPTIATCTIATSLILCISQLPRISTSYCIKLGADISNGAGTWFINSSTCTRINLYFGLRLPMKASHLGRMMRWGDRYGIILSSNQQKCHHQKQLHSSSHLAYTAQVVRYFRVRDSVIPCHDDFKLYITTKLPNPHSTPEISTRVTLVNFTLLPGWAISYTSTYLFSGWSLR